ncbi:MAG: hypothetical protein F4213_22945, partial [Boseongicola sp. SB0677_bin_26]|nr:hypothetical protein [Boseongicola sp. SB0677_bin_26]
LDKKIKVKVGFKDDAGNAESRTSDAHPESGTVAAAASTSTAGGIWSATLTVDEASRYAGCANAGVTGVNALNDCSTTAVLSDDDFVHGGTTYTISGIFYDDTGGGTNQNLQVSFASVTPAAAKTALAGLSLTVGSGATARTVAIADATSGYSGALDFGFNPGWSSGDTVALSLTAPASANSAATGMPTVSSTATVGQTLTAARGTIADTDGVTKAEAGDAGFAWTYQWIRVDGDGTSNPVNIPGATSGTYVLKAADQGRKVKVKVGFKDDAGNAESRTSDAHPGTGTVAGESTGTPPPAADITVWEATLTVVEPTSGWLGCDSGVSGRGKCLKRKFLSEDEFEFQGNRFTVSRFLLRTATGDVWWDFSGGYGSGLVARRVLGAATLHVDGRSFAVGDADADTNKIILRGANPGWTSGQEVSLRLTVPPPPPPGPKPPRPEDAVLVWDATLTVDVSADGTGFGCYNKRRGSDPCTRNRALDSPKFKFGGTGYKVTSLEWYTIDDTLDLIFDGVTGGGARDALGALTLHVDGREFAIGDTSHDSTKIWWTDANPGWVHGQQVTLYLTAPRPPERLANLQAIPMNGSVRLAWDEPASYAEPPIDTIHARWKEKGGKWTGWKDIGDVGGYTVTGLTNGKLYRFQVRAAGPGGEGEASDTASAKPLPKPAPPRHLIANAADASVILHWDISPDDSLAEYRYRFRAGSSTGAWRGGWRDIPRREDPPNHPGYYAPGGLSDVTVTGLSNGTRYMFQVRARNGNGWGKPSETAYATPAAAPAPPQAVSVAHDWALIPGDAGGDPLVKPGERFRLLFVTGAATAATNTDINSYNAFVQERADANGDLRPFRDGFRAVISTAAANARDNIGNDPDVPVYWTGGGMVVGGPYSDGLFEDAWIDRTPRDEGGKASTATRAWTGSDRSGHSWSWGNTVGTRFYAGAPHVWTGNPSGGLDHRGDPFGRGGISDPTWGSGGKPPASGTQLPLYGISPVITVREPPSSAVWSATLTVDSGSAFGCRTGGGWPYALDDCSDTDVLTEDGFTHAGTAYAVEAVASSTGKLLFGLAGVAPADARTALAGLVLHVGAGEAATSHAVSDATEHCYEGSCFLSWDASLGWRHGGEVALRLGAPATTGSSQLRSAPGAIGPPALSVADARAKEGEDATIDFAVTLSRAATGPVTVRYATRDGTARKGEDYRQAKGTLAFAAGETSRTVSVTVLDDAVDEGEETFRLLLTKATGAVIADGEAVGTIENDDPVPGAWLARFGRTVADQAVDAVRSRLDADRSPGFRGRIAGKALPDGTGTEETADGGAAGDPLAVPELAEDERRAFMALLALETGEGLEPDAGETRAVTADEALLGTAFELVRETEGGLSLGLWGRVARSGFSGRAGELSLDGDVTSAMIGTDWTRRDALFGLMLFRSRGEGGYAGRAGEGGIEAELSGLVPWAGLRKGGAPTLWAAAGTGRGEMTLKREDGDPVTAGLGWSMLAAGAAGAPATLDALGGAHVGWRADAMATRTRSDAAEPPGAGRLAASDTGTTRLRLGLEAAWSRTSASGATLSHRLEAGLRHDGGDAETGFGLEAGGGVRFEDPGRGLSLSLDGRTLALHEDGDLRDWGLSVTFGWDPRPETRLGPSVVATRGWGGAASGGVDALLGPETVPGLAAADGDGTWSLEAAWGIRRGRGMAGVPHLRAAGADGLDELRLGWRIEPDADHAADASLELWAEPGVAGNGPGAGAGLRWRW